MQGFDIMLKILDFKRSGQLKPSDNVMVSPQVPIIIHCQTAAIYSGR